MKTKNNLTVGVVNFLSTPLAKRITFLSILFLGLSLSLFAQTHEYKEYWRPIRGYAKFTTDSNNSICDGSWNISPNSTPNPITPQLGGDLCVSDTTVDSNLRLIERQNFIGLTVIDSIGVPSWSYKIELEIQRSNGGSPVTQTYDAWIDYDPDARKRHQDRIMYQLPGAYKEMELTSITILDSTGSNVLSSFEKNWMIELLIMESVYDTSDFDTIYPVANFISNKDIELKWAQPPSTLAPEPCWFQLEWVFVDDSTAINQSIPSLFQRGSTRIGLNNNEYKLTNHFSIPGTLHFRVRCVRPAWDNSSSSINEDVNIFSPWEYQQLTVTGSHTVLSDSINWSYNAGYNEGGRRLENIGYFDGLGVPRQDVTKPHEYDSLVIIGETFSDFAGNPAISVTPAPIRSTNLRFQEGLNDFVGPAQNEKIFFETDTLFPFEMDSASGSNQYYSSNIDIPSNHPLIDLTPRSEGYAYSYMEYDASGRIRYENIPGKTFRVDIDSTAPNRFTKHEYFKAKRSDIYPFFGNHASHHEDYTVEDVKDPNGQRTSTITDAKGRVVLTAISNPPENLMAIDTKPDTVYTIEDLLDGTSYNIPLPNSNNPTSYQFEYALPIRGNSDVLMNYEAIGNFLSVCESFDTLCYQCKYEAEVTLVRETGDTVLNWNKGDLSLDSTSLAQMKTCSPDSLFMFDVSTGIDSTEFTVLPLAYDTTHDFGGGVIFTLNEGRYIVKKKLKLMSNNKLDILADDYIDNATESECLKDEYYFVDSTTTAANYQCPQTYSNYTAEDGPCSDLKKEMMAELYPTQGKYASFFSGIQTADTFSLFKAILNQPIYGPNLLTNGDFESGNTGFVSEFPECSGTFNNSPTIKMQKRVATDPSQCLSALDNSANLGDNNVLAVMKSATDFERVNHLDSLGFLDVNPDTHNLFLIYGVQVNLDSGQTYNFRGEFWDMTDLGSLAFLPSAIRVFIDSTQIGVIHINTPNPIIPHLANFNYTADTSETFHLMVMADFGCCGWSPTLDDSTHLNYAMDNLTFSTIDYSCGCEGLGLPNPSEITPIYPYQCLDSAFDASGIVALGSNPASLSIVNFIESCDTSWLETMLPAHPEYCNLKNCEIIYSDSSVAFLQKLNEYGWQDALAEWPSYAYDTTGNGQLGLFPHDPLFAAISNPQHELHYIYLEMEDRLKDYFWFGTNHLSIDQAIILFSWPAANMLSDTALISASGDTALLGEWLQYATDTNYDPAYIGAAVWEKYAAAYEQIRNFIANNYYRTCLDCDFDTLITTSLKYQAEQKIEAIKAKSYLLFGDSNLMFDDTLNYQAYYNFVDSMEIITEQEALSHCFDWLIFQLQNEFALTLDTNDSLWYIAGTNITDSALADTLQYYCAGDSSLASIEAVYDSLGIPQNLQQNPYLLEVTQPYEELYSMLELFSSQWEGCFDKTAAGDSVETLLIGSDTLPGGLHWYNPIATGYQLPGWTSGNSLTFSNFSCDSLMIQNSMGTMGSYASFHFFMVDVEDGSNSTTLRGFYNSSPVFDDEGTAGPLALSLPEEDERFYCPDLYDVVEDFFNETIIVNYIDTPLYTPPGGTADTLELAWHPAFDPLIAAYVSESVGENHGQFEIIEMIASCSVIDSLTSSIPELAFHFADSVFYDTRPICAVNSEWDCDSCDWFYDEIISYEYAHPTGSAMRIDSIRTHFAGLGVDTNAWRIEYPYDVNTENYNHLFSYQKSDYHNGLFHFIDSTLNEWNDPDSVVPNGGSITLYGYFDDFPSNGMFPFGSYSGVWASMDSISEGLNAPTKCWIRHSGNGRVWFHFALEDAPNAANAGSSVGGGTFHDIFLDYKHYESGFELSELDTLVFIQPFSTQGPAYDFYAGFLDTNKQLQIIRGTASFPIAYMCDIPALSLVQRPSNQADFWKPNCMENIYSDAFEDGQDLYELYIENKQNQFKDDYLAACRESLQESLIWGSDLGTYHYTLYFYDRADNLIKTVPPEGVNVPTKTLPNGKLVIDTSYNIQAMDYIKGLSSTFRDVNHSMETTYEYDAYNNVIRQETPDGGVSRFFYDRLGRIQFSQNAQQATNADFSYSLYDNLSRITESGQYQAMDSINVVGAGGGLKHVILRYGNGYIYSDTLMKSVPQAIVNSVFTTNNQNVTSTMTFDQVAFIAEKLDESSWQQYISGRTRTHVVVTRYDYQSLYGWQSYGSGTDRNLRNRVSAMYKYDRLSIGGTSDYDNGIVYHYDVAGNVKTLFREVKDLGFKVSKKFEYIYDQISGNVYEMRYQRGEEDALWHRYSYDAQNRLKFVETSRNGVIWDVDAEYEYYAHGPLARVTIGNRAIQSVEYAYTLQGWLKSINGMKPLSPSESSPSEVKDLFAMDLEYFDGDFKPVNPNAYSAIDSVEKHDLFNGNIAGINKRLVQPQQTIGSAAQEYLNTGKKYRYDQLNRIKEYWDIEIIDTLANWHWGSINGVYTNYKYDGNGNIETLQRTGSESENDPPTIMDSLDYVYQPGTNRLTSVCETTPQERFCCDIDETFDAPKIWKPYGTLLPDSVVTNVQIPGTFCQNLDQSWPFLSNGAFSCDGLDVLGIYQDSAAAYDSDTICGVDTVNAEFSIEGGGTITLTIVTALRLNGPEYTYDAIGNLISDKESGLKIAWNPIGKVKRIDKFKEQSSKYSEGGLLPGMINPECPDCEVEIGTTNPGGGGGEDPVYIHHYLTKKWEGTLTFDYDPMGERIKKRNRMAEEVIAHSNTLANWNDTTLEQADIVGTCISHPDRYTYYMRDAQGNLIATYNLALELKNRKKFHLQMLQNLEDLWDVSPRATWDSLIDPIVEGRGDFRRELLRQTDHDLGDILDSIDYNTVFDADPGILVLLNDNYDDVHPIGFWDRYPTQCAELIRGTQPYQDYIEGVAEDMADSIYADEIDLYSDHETTLEGDIATAWSSFTDCISINRCTEYPECFDCESQRGSPDYNTCMSSHNCEPPYCGECETAWNSYDALADLLTLWDRYEDTEDSIVSNLLSGSGSYLKKYYFDDVDMPLSHTESAMESTLITGDSLYRVYLDTHYATINWKNEILPIVDNNRLLDEHFPAVAKDWFIEGMDTVGVTDTLEAFAELLSDSSSAMIYRPEDFLADLDEVYGANTWVLLLNDSTDTASFETALAAYKVLHPGKFDGIEDMAGFQGIVSARKPRKYLAYKMVPEQYFVYGSSRLGSIYHYKTQREISGRVENTNTSGERRYELSDHLGNVQVVMSDRLAQTDTGGSNAVDVFEGDVWSVMDYYPFGMLMRDRSANMEEMRLERSMFTDTVEVITWTKKTIDQPHPSTNAFQQPLDASNRKFKGKAWVSTTDQTANPDFVDSTSQSSPIVYQYNGTSTEMQLAGLGYKSMRIEYNINSATVPALADNDSFVVQLTAIFDGSYKATRVEVRDHSTNQLIKQQVITNPPNNFGTPVTIGFGVGSLDSIDIIVRAEFTNTSSYVPDTSQGVSNWTNGIYLQNWSLTHYRRNSKEKVVSDTSDYFYRNKYAFGFNGMYRDDEVYGGGNSYDFGARIYNPRLGRWLSVDPLQIKYPGWSAYNFSVDNPVLFMDPDGKDARITITDDKSGGPTIVTISTTIHVKNMTETVKNNMNSMIANQSDLTTTIDGKDYLIKFDISVQEFTDESAIMDGDNIVTVVGKSGSDVLADYASKDRLQDNGLLQRDIGPGNEMVLSKGNNGKGDSFMHEVGHFFGLEHRWIYVETEYGRIPVTQDDYKSEQRTTDAMGKPGGPNFIQGDQFKGLIEAAQKQQQENGKNTQVIDGESRVTNYNLPNHNTQQVNEEQ